MLFRRGTDDGVLREDFDVNLTGDYEGTQSRTDIVYPLWSLSRKWGAGIVLSHFDGVRRRFGSSVADGRVTSITVHAPARPADRPG